MTKLMRPDHEVFTQRNNLVHPDETCWPTSMIQALHIRDIRMPPGKYKQPEDNLADFCMKDSRVRDLHSKVDPERAYKPWQVHRVLNSAVNWWLGWDVTEHRFSADTPDLHPFLDKGRCVVISGRFPYYSGKPIHHAICVCGHTDEGYYICDPWGDYEELYASGVKCVRDKIMPYKDFEAYMGNSFIIV